MTTTAPTRSFLGRIWMYSREMFPLHLYVPYVVTLYACLNFSAQAIAGTDIIIDIYGIVGMVSAFCMMLLLRTFDELKDVEIDKELFPDRALPRGDVKVSDVATLAIIAFTVLVVINIFFAQETLPWFALMLVYAVLTYKWFFAEKYHRENLFFTMMTHQPLPFFITFYLISTALHSGGLASPFSFKHLILLFLFALPVTAWETGRKIRSPDMETEYVTFSKIFGPRGATFIPYTCLVLSGLFCLYTGWQLKLASAFFVVTIALILYVAFFFTRFILDPTHKNNVMKNVAMVFTTLLFLNMLGHILLAYSVKNIL